MTTEVQIPRGEDKRDLKFPPALMEKIRDDPLELQPAARVMATTLLYEQYKESGSYTPAQKLALSQELSKLGGMEPKKQEQQALGAQFSIQINIPEVGVNAASSRIIEVTNEEVQLPEILGELSAQRQVPEPGVRASWVDEDDDLDYQDSD